MISFNQGKAQTTSKALWRPNMTDGGQKSKKGTYGVLTMDEYSKIVGQTREMRDNEEEKMERKRRLKEISDRRVQNWGNTIEGTRSKLEQEREEKNRIKEAEMKRLEQEEAEIQAEIKRKQIEKLNKMRMMEDDRVKTISGKVLLNEVMIERERQLDRTSRCTASLGSSDMLRRCSRSNGHKI